MVIILDENACKFSFFHRLTKQYSKKGLDMDKKRLNKIMSLFMGLGILVMTELNACDGQGGACQGGQCSYSDYGYLPNDDDNVPQGYDDVPQGNIYQQGYYEEAPQDGGYPQGYPQGGGY
ncbi:MAG: hypothetical protein LBS71_01900 [Puniceicoccales bacterium]|jgi:hypothetical protein|nr:hypothetical protein [Puniceicoccales bacterium]